MKVGRRSFLGTMAAGAAALKLAERTSEAALRSYTAGRFALELDGAIVAWLQSVKGGDARADVVVEGAVGGFYPKKRLATVSYGEIEMSLALPDSGPLADWVGSTLSGNYDYRDGAIVAVDVLNKEVWRREFTGALITEVQFPVLDAATKDSAFLTLKLQPFSTNRAKGSGAMVGTTMVPKKWISSHFRLSLGNLDCSRVTRIDSLTIRRSMQKDEFGREYTPGNFEVTDLEVRLPEAYAQDFVLWHEDFVIQGKCMDGDELNGRIDILAPDLLGVIGRIELSNVGIFAISDEASSASSDAIRTVKAEMYVEKVGFKF